MGVDSFLRRTHVQVDAPIFIDPTKSHNVKACECTMSRKPRQHALLLSRNVGDRILIGALALTIGLISGLVLQGPASRRRPSGDLSETLWGLLLDEALFTTFVLCSLALVWAVAAPRWLENLLQRMAVKVVFGTLLFIGIILWMASWP